VNKAHLEFCASPEWARLVEDELLPWILDGYELGDDLLEVGPGPGLTTDVLRQKAARITAVELDLDLAGKLASRLAGSNVRVIAGDVTRLPFPAGRFSSAACLTMLVLDYADGTLQRHRSSLRAAITGIMRQFAPDTVVTFGTDGGYGHPDHMAISEQATEAFRAVVRDHNQGQRLYHAVFPPPRTSMAEELGAAPDSISDRPVYASPAPARTDAGHRVLCPRRSEDQPGRRRRKSWPLPCTGPGSTSRNRVGPAGMRMTLLPALP
jgi:SAM-dependent methyltransferase